MVRIAVTIFVGFGVLGYTACDWPVGLRSSTVDSPRTAVVEYAEAHGAGDVDSATDAALSAWMARHPDAGRALQILCGRVPADRPASWSQTSEGRICEAEQATRFHRPVDQIVNTNAAGGAVPAIR